jgi:hypothetical protein
MSPGISEEAGKVAISTIDALKASPALLVLVFLQVATLVMIHYGVRNSQEMTKERELAMLERCFPLDREKN